MYGSKPANVFGMLFQEVFEWKFTRLVQSAVPVFQPEVSAYNILKIRKKWSFFISDLSSSYLYCVDILSKVFVPDHPLYTWLEKMHIGMLALFNAFRVQYMLFGK